jgi:hypothetical protein
MLDDLYQADTEAAINDLIKRPPQTPTPQASKFSVWKTLTAAPRGVATGANETAGGIADVLGAFGQTMAATDARSGMFSTQTPEQRKQETQARRKMLDEGLEFSAGDDFRQQARQWMPDAATSHVAEQTVFGLTRFGTKAVAGAAVAGPVAGAGLVGLDEALTTADDLKRQGVDPLTRSQVGAVVGLTSALGVALPVAGKTATQTAALVAVGGPLSFMGQQAATREILQAADYTHLADQYDPLDPVGLAVSTIIPAGFGMWAMRGVRMRAAGKTADTPELAPDRSPAPEGDAARAEDSAQTEPLRPTPEQVDAARVEMLTQHIESAGLHSADDARAAAMHLDAFARAADDLSAGRRVDVTDLVPVERLQVARALDTFAQGLDTARTDLIAQASKLAEPTAVRQMQAELTDAQVRLAELESPDAVKARAADLQQSERLSFKQAMAQARKEFGAQAADVQARVDRLEGMLADNAQGQQAFDALNILNRQAEQARRQRAQIDAPPTRETPTAAAAREAASLTTPEPRTNVQDAPRTDAPAAGRADTQPSPAPAKQGAQPSRTDAGGAGPAGAGEQGSAGVSGARGNAAEAGLVAQRLAEVQQQFPDLTVQMDGMDKPMPLADFLAQVQREAMEGSDFDLGGNDAPLMQVAATCFLLNG